MELIRSALRITGGVLTVLLFFIVFGAVVSAVIDALPQLAG